MSPKCNECSWNDCGKTIFSLDEAYRSLDDSRVSFTSSFDLLAMKSIAKNAGFVYKRRKFNRHDQKDCRKTSLSPDEACKSLANIRVSFTSSFDLSTMKRTAKNVDFVYKRRKCNECNLSGSRKTSLSTSKKTAKNVGFVYKRRKCNEWDRNDCKKTIFPLDEAFKSLDNIRVPFTSSFDLSRIKRTANYAGFVYKRRKFDRNLVTYLSENATESLNRSAKCNNDCYKDACGETILSEGEEACETLTNVGVSFSNSSDLSTTKRMFPVPSPKRVELVYKRRKFDRNSVAFVPKDTTRRIACPCSCTSSKEQSVELHGCTERNPATMLSSSAKDLHRSKPATVPTSQVEPILRNGVNDAKCMIECEISMETSNRDLCKPLLNSITDDRCSSSVSCVPSSMKKEGKGGEQCSSMDADVVEQSNESTSVKELCISVLKSHGLLGEARTTGKNDPIVVPRDEDTNCSQTCKICGLLENPLKMLICDICGEAFHLSCCKPKMKEIPVGEWYCQTCFRKKPISLSARYSRTKRHPSEESKSGSGRLGRGSIALMLKDTQPYTSGVPIGEDFQADVPDWPGPMPDSDSYHN